MNRVRVLLADDHKPLLYHVARMLESDFDVVGALTDGQALLEAATRLQPDVLVLDISMPGLSGLQVARELKKAGSHAKIVFLTVHEESDFVQESFASGGSAYVIKPRLGTDLALAIREALAGHTFISPSLSLNN
ncbi:MAG: response regulator [Candidatus Acidiferrales bacterium]